jgi:hypothetical protein
LASCWSAPAQPSPSIPSLRSCSPSMQPRGTSRHACFLLWWTSSVRRHDLILGCP